MSKHKCTCDNCANARVSTEFSCFFVVPWPTTRDGQPVHTNGIVEDALELTFLISGWCEGGFFSRTDRCLTPLLEHIASIDWDRVARVCETFDIPFNVGDKPGDYFGSQLLVTLRRYNALFRRCFKSVSDTKFERYVEDTVSLFKPR